jgi:hypothetical protein
VAEQGDQHEVVVQIPDIGLSKEQLSSLKESFKNQIVSTMGHKSGAAARIVVVVIRVVRASQEV